MSQVCLIFHKKDKNVLITVRNAGFIHYDAKLNERSYLVYFLCLDKAVQFVVLKHGFD